jgi:hypothetical protein
MYIIMIIVMPKYRKGIPRWDANLANVHKSLIKIQIDRVFWFENDLNFNNKNTHEQYQRWWKMKNKTINKEQLNDNKQ